MRRRMQQVSGEWLDGLAGLFALTLLAGTKTKGREVVLEQVESRGVSRDDDRGDTQPTQPGDAALRPGDGGSADRESDVGSRSARGSGLSTSGVAVWEKRQEQRPGLG
jgi:hypothetical protein